MNIRRSLLIALSQSYVQMGLQFAASLIIARLLTVYEIGVFSVSMVLIAMVNTFRDFGVVDYVVQEKDLTPGRIRAASMLTFVTAWSIAALVGGLAGFVADFYRDPDIAWVMRLLAINFILLPFGSVAMAHMRRNLRFDDWSKIRVAGALTQTCLSVLLAYLGMSYFSMALGSVAAACVTIILSMKYRDHETDFRPGLGDLRHVFSFGGINTGINIMLESSKGLPDMILGRLVNLEAVGYFSRATGLIDVFNRMVVQAVNLVALPHLSARLRRGEEVIPAYLQGVSYLTAVAWPFHLFLSFNAAPLIRLLFGGQWEHSIGLLAVLALGEILLAPTYLQQQLFVASGRIRAEALRQLLMLAVRALPFLLLSSMGLAEVAMGCVAGYAVILALSLWMQSRYLGIRVRSLLHALIPSIVLALLMSGVLWLLSSLAPSEYLDQYWFVLVSGVFMSLAWVGCLSWLKHPLSREIRTVLGKFRSGRD